MCIQSFELKKELRFTNVIFVLNQLKNLSKVSPDSLNRGLVIRSVITNGAVAREGTLEAGDIITCVNGSDVAGLETEKARQLIRHHSFHSNKVVNSWIA